MLMISGRHFAISCVVLFWALLVNSQLFPKNVKDVLLDNVLYQNVDHQAKPKEDDVVFEESDYMQDYAVTESELEQMLMDVTAATTPDYCYNYDQVCGFMRYDLQTDQELEWIPYCPMGCVGEDRVCTKITPPNMRMAWHKYRCKPPGWSPTPWSPQSSTTPIPSTVSKRSGSIAGEL